MRLKTLKLVIAFYTTADAMATEAIFTRANIKGRLIPVPREISSGCGIAWSMLPEDYDNISENILQQLPEAESKTKIMI